MKNIILFIENYVPGGNDQIALDLINNIHYEKLYLFVNKRHDLRIINSQLHSSKVQKTLYSIITVAEINSFAKSYKNKNYILYLFLSAFALLARYPWIVISTIYFYYMFKNIDFDLFISNNGGYPGGEANRSATVAASMIQKRNNFHIVHNLAPKPPLYLKLFETIYDKLLDERTTFICVSNQTKEHLINNRVIKQTPLVVQNGVKLPQSGLKKIYDEPILKLLCVANLDSRKNQILSLKSLAILKKQGIQNIKLYFLGKESEPGYLSKLKQFIEDNDLSDWVQFEGFKDPILYYKECHILLLTSIIESFALVRVEAMSYNMPIITTDVGDAHEQVINSKNGYIISNEDELADKILFYKNNRFSIENHGIVSKEIFLQKFTLPQMISNYTKIFEGFQKTC
ncbi:MAG: glycosyltransferase [Epsilonproteobacteria bacterium]|nr:glycosyltransferase [Campylobacterota bacterium]